jgi:hypothetical protein
MTASNTISRVKSARGMVLDFPSIYTMLASQHARNKSGISPANYTRCVLAALCLDDLLPAHGMRFKHSGIANLRPVSTMCVFEYRQQEFRFTFTEKNGVCGIFIDPADASLSNSSQLCATLALAQVNNDSLMAAFVRDLIKGIDYAIDTGRMSRHLFDYPARLALSEVP